ncbi:MAG: glutathione S-transferase N-terminal domain-containing protein [Nitrosomonas sp.]|nr:glutathione S-transferase N-terminal domain-containing protein [Nitrosomonas sp.]
MSKTKKQLKGHQLYYFASCPFCIKVRLALWWMGFELQQKDILSSAKNKNELLAGGGKTQVPCLRIEHEEDEVRWLYESEDIIRYLKQQSVRWHLIG